jgi:transcriptional regulator with XRE-family HTH domain
LKPGAAPEVPRTALPFAGSMRYDRIMTEQQAIACQLRGARAMTRLTVAELARRARIAPNTIVRIESGRKVSPNSLAAVRGALEASGIEFLERGIRLRDAGGEEQQGVPERVEHVLSLARQIASLPVVEEDSPDEIVGYDDFGAPS